MTIIYGLIQYIEGPEGLQSKNTAAVDRFQTKWKVQFVVRFLRLLLCWEEIYSKKDIALGQVYGSGFEHLHTKKAKEKARGEYQNFF